MIYFTTERWTEQDVVYATMGPSDNLSMNTYQLQRGLTFICTTSSKF